MSDSNFPSRETIRDIAGWLYGLTAPAGYVENLVALCHLYGIGQLQTPQEASTSDHDVLRVRWPEEAAKEAHISFLDAGKNWIGVTKAVTRPAAAPQSPPPQEEGTDEKCDNCGMRYGTIYRVHDEVWAAIHERAPGGLLCPKCAEDRAARKGIRLYWEAHPYDFPSKITKPSVGDPPRESSRHAAWRRERDSVVQARAGSIPPEPPYSDDPPADPEPGFARIQTRVDKLRAELEGMRDPEEALGVIKTLLFWYDVRFMELERLYREKRS